MSLRDLIRTSWRGASANKLRAILTMLGIIIGVASVIAMLALGNGARAAVEARFRSLGANQVQISEAMSFSDGKIEQAGEILSYQDGLLMPENVDLVDYVDMSIGGSGKARFGRATLDTSIQGVTANALAHIASAGEVQPVNWPEGTALTADDFLADGRFFTASEVLETGPVCVLGSQTAIDLFGGDDPIGHRR